MKKSIIFLLIPLAFSCTQKESVDNAVPPVYIGGVIKNLKTDTVFLRKDVHFDIVRLDSAGLDSTGRFSFTKAVYDTGYYMLTAGNENARLYLIPGDSIYLFADALDFDKSLRFSGIGMDANNFLAKKLISRASVMADFESLYKQEPDAFLRNLDSIKKMLEDELNSFATQAKGFDKKFTNYEQADILYWLSVRKEEYQDYHRYFTNNPSYEVPENFYSYVNSLSFNEAPLLAVKSYTQYLQTHLGSLADKELQKDTTRKNKDNAFETTQYRIAKNIINDTLVRNFMLTSILQQQFMYAGIENSDEIFNDYLKVCTDKEYKDKITSLRAKWENLASGKEAPDFRFSDFKGDTVSLSGFRGKYVYIDVWATWCGPCKREQPYLEKLNEDFKNKNIVFVSVSVDESKEPWIKFLNEKKLKGVQLYADGAWKSPIAKNYFINSIPRFILIDREGKIINANAPRPSGKIHDVLNGLEGMNI